MNVLAALKFVADFLLQLTSLGEVRLKRLVGRMNYVRALMDTVNLPPIRDFRTYLRSVTYPLDSARQPHLPDKRWRVERHDDLPEDFDWNLEKVILFQDPRQGVEEIEPSDVIEGLRARREEFLLLNAVVGEMLYADSPSVPDSWRGKRVYFFGTRFVAGGWYRVLALDCRGEEPELVYDYMSQTSSPTSKDYAAVWPR